MHRVWIAVAAFALAACVPTYQEAPAPTPAPAPAPAPALAPPASGAVPAPTPASVSQRLTASDDGRTISVPLGGRFAVELVGVPTAGYVWQVDEKPAFLSDAVESSGNTTRAQSKPGFTGGNHWEVFVFTANGAGQARLKLGQRRPWEKNEPPTQTFTVTIRVQ
jgi:inhibitor of cysteine peptidase